MPSRDAPSSLWHYPSRIANASITSSLANRWPNAVALNSCTSGGGSLLLFSSPRSGRGLARSASGIFARCDPCSVCWAVDRPLLQSISGFLAFNHRKPKTRLYAFIGMTTTSDSLPGLRCSNYWTMRLAFRLSFADIITWRLRPWVEVNAGSCGNLSVLSRLGDTKMLIEPQSVSALTCCMLPCILITRTSWMIWAESGLSVLHRY